MNMFVVMANDFPEAAYFDEAKAKQFVAERQKEDADRVKGGFAKIYWCAYRIPVKDAAAC